MNEMNVKRQNNTCYKGQTCSTKIIGEEKSDVELTKKQAKVITPQSRTPPPGKLSQSRSTNFLIDIKQKLSISRIIIIIIIILPTCAKNVTHAMDQRVVPTLAKLVLFVKD